jgi:hypothetical protein
MLYTLPWTGFELTTLVVIGTDCKGSCKSNQPYLIPHSTNIVLCCRSVVKYGELELFLCGLDLSDYVNLFQQQHVDFSIILRMTDEDLIKV